MGKIIVRKMLKTAFAEFGAEMRRGTDGLFIIRYKLLDYYMDLDESAEAFCLIEVVEGLNGDLSENDYEVMMSVLKEFYPECDGDWNDGQPYICSQWYGIKDEHGECSSARLEKIFKDFFAIWTFACANASLASQQ